MIGELVEARVDCITLNDTCCAFILESPQTVLERVGRDLADAGIRVRALHAPFGREANLSDIREDRRLGTLGRHLSLIGRLPLLGIPILHIHPGADEQQDVYGQDPRRLKEILRRSLTDLVSAAGTAGVTLALENMPASLGSPEELVEIMHWFDSPRLGVLLDTGHAHVRDGVARSFQTVREHLVDFHVHDNSGLRDDHLQPPYGTIDWAAFLSGLAGCPAAEVLTIEALPWGRAGLARMARETEAFFGGRLPSCRIGGRKAIARCPVCGHILLEDPKEPACCC